MGYNNCSHIEDLFHLDIYILNSGQYESIASTDYDANYCHDEFSSQFQIQNCWYFTLAAQKYAIPINGSYKSSHSVVQGEYYIFVVNPCNITYKISGSISMQNPWTSFGHLPVSLKFHPQIVMIAASEYLVGLLVWICYCFRHRESIVIHHKLLSLMLLVQTFDYLVYWLSYLVYDS